MIPSDKTIPEGSIEIQKGLWLYSYKKTISGTEYTFNQLFSSEGYCFYNKTMPEEQRGYYQWMSLGFDNNTSMYVPIPISEMPENGNIA